MARQGAANRAMAWHLAMAWHGMACMGNAAAMLMHVKETCICQTNKLLQPSLLAAWLHPCMDYQQPHEHTVDVWLLAIGELVLAIAGVPHAGVH
eukprot:353770-Chlamydomonas_euryale.AAC.3